MTKRLISPVHIPPRKKRSAGKTITLKFVLTGTVPSKKNMQVPTINRKAINRKIDVFYQANVNIQAKNFVKWAKGLIKDVKPFIRNPEKFRIWEESTKELIVERAKYWKQRYEHEGLIFPITRCSISIYHYWSDNYTRDNSNKAETIHDILVATGIIADDTYQCLFKTESEAECYKGEILDHITEIYITAHRWK
jgi:hypothetical protein